MNDQVFFGKFPFDMFYLPAFMRKHDKTYLFNNDTNFHAGIKRPCHIQIRQVRH